MLLTPSPLLILGTILVLVLVVGLAVVTRRSVEPAEKPVTPLAELTPVPLPVHRPNVRKKVFTTKVTEKPPTIKVVPRAQAVSRREIPPERAWYYRKDTRPAGPFELEELRELWRNGRITGQTLIWSERLRDDWCPVESVDLNAGRKRAVAMESV